MAGRRQARVLGQDPPQVRLACAPAKRPPAQLQGWTRGARKGTEFSPGPSALLVRCHDFSPAPDCVSLSAGRDPPASQELGHSLSLSPLSLSQTGLSCPAQPQASPRPVSATPSKLEPPRMAQPQIPGCVSTSSRPSGLHTLLDPASMGGTRLAPATCRPARGLTSFLRENMLASISISY